MARTTPKLPPGDEREYLRTVEALSRDIRDPVDKLRFLRGSLGTDRPFDRPQPDDATPPAPQPLRAPAGSGRRTPAPVVVAAATAGALGMLALVVAPAVWRGPEQPLAVAALGPPTSPFAAAEGWRPSPPMSWQVDQCDALAGPTPADAAERPETVAGPADVTALALDLGWGPDDRMLPGPLGAGTAVAAGTPGDVVPPPLEQAPLGIRPAAVWLVEAGPGWELYSNGLRIETTWAVDGEKRRYRAFTETGGMAAEPSDRPAGILFHTTESHVWPMEAAYNDALRDSSQNLVQYVSRERLYHYLIDRFGRVYRAVRDDAKANHAGHGVWQHGDRVYLNLNHAFLGVSFETRWAGGSELPLTEAQITAGRVLTAWLRQRWEIAPEMCVAHGLTSVSPRRHLIGYHLDWARGFPFAAFGLPDQYRRIAPSVRLFGFGYDRDFLDTLGAPWEGVVEAERLLAEEAARTGVAVDGVRRTRRALYDRWLREQAAADDESQRAEARTTSGGS